MLPVLAVLAFAAMGTVSYAFLASADFEEACAQQERHVNAIAVKRARSIRRRIGVPPASGTLVAEPRDQQDVRAMITFCDTATAADVPALRNVALRAESSLAVGNAVRALGRLHAMAKDPELLKLLDDPRDRVRDETILALGESHDASVLDRLQLLAGGNDDHTRTMAVRAVGRVGGERARRILVEVVADPAVTRETAAFARAGLAAWGR